MQSQGIHLSCPAGVLVKIVKNISFNFHKIAAGSTEDRIAFHGGGKVVKHVGGLGLELIQNAFCAPPHEQFLHFIVIRSLYFWYCSKSPYKLIVIAGIVLFPVFSHALLIIPRNNPILAIVMHIEVCTACVYDCKKIVNHQI